MGSNSAQTFLHELSHAIDYKLPRFEQDLVINEIVAELSSAFLGSLYGVKMDINNTIAYIQGYNGKADIVINVMKSLQRVEGIYEYIEKSKASDSREIKPNIA
jgi:antirestriction protein ArdC